MLKTLAATVASIVLAGALLMSGGCGGDSGSGASADGASGSNSSASQTRPFRFVNRGDVITLDLNQVSYLQDFRVLFAIREGLYTYNAQTLKAEPALAVSHEKSADQRVWTFKLRDAKWSNGDPVTAGDFVFSWRQMLENPGEYTYLFYYIKGAKQYETDHAEGKSPDFASVGVKALDGKTLQVTLEDPVLFLEDLLAFPPFYPRNEASMAPFKEVREGRTTYRDEYTRPPAVVTNGPFKLVDWKLGQYLRFEKDPNYWDVEKVKLHGIEMVVNNDPISAYQMFDSGQIDWLADVQPNIAVDLKDVNSPVLRTGPGFGTHFVTLNCRPSVPGVIEKNPLADVRVRQALGLAIDKKKIIDTITRMGEQVATTYVPPGIFEGYEPRGGQAMDVARARQLLAEAGYPEGRGFPRLPVIYNTDNKTREQIAQVLGSQWKQNLGIDIEVRGLELTGGYRPAVKNKQYALALVAWFGDYGDPSTFTDKYLSTSQNNDADWRSPAFDDLLGRAAKELDPAKRFDILMEAESLINKELPILPLYHAVNYSLFRDHVKGLYMNPKQLTIWKGVSVER